MKNTIPLSIAKCHKRMDDAKQNQRERKRDVYQQPAVEPAVQLLLASELARFVTNVFEVAKRDMSRGRQQSAKPCKDTARSCRIAETAA